jgi:hypothetical protein
LTLLRFAGVGREQAERSSGIAAKQAVSIPELRRQGSLLPACKKIDRTAWRNAADLSFPLEANAQGYVLSPLRGYLLAGVLRGI